MSGSDRQPPARTSGLVRLMIDVIESERTGLDLAELAGELIAETARFNLHGLHRKSTATTTARELWNLATVLESCLADCASAWESYTRSADDPAGRERVRSALRAAAARLRAARAGDVPDDPDLPEELLDL